MRRPCCSLLLLSLALALAACASVDATLELHEDGSGVRTVLVLVDETSYNLALASGMSDPLAQIAAETGRRGATVEPASEFARKGLRITQTFDRLGDIPPLPPLDDVAATRRSDLLGAHYAVTVTVDTAQLAAMTRGVEQLPLSSLKLTYNMALPGRVREHNADIAAGNTLTWTLDPTAGSTRVLTATSEVPYDLTAAYIAAASVLIALPLAVVVGLTLVGASQRRRAERPSALLSGCLGVAVGLTLLVCLALALLAGYLTLEGRIFPLPPENAGPTPAPTAAGLLVVGASAPPFTTLHLRFRSRFQRLWPNLLAARYA